MGTVHDREQRRPLLPCLGLGISPYNLVPACPSNSLTIHAVRVQVQERITHQVADAVAAELQAALAEAAPSSSQLSEARNAAPACAEGPANAAAGWSAATCTAEDEQSNGRHAGDGVGCSGRGSGDGCGSSVGGWGVMVVCDAAHMCMVARGVENHSGSTTTLALRGVFRQQPELRGAVLRAFRTGGSGAAARTCSC